MTIKYSERCNANWAVLKTNGASYSTEDPILLSVGVQDMVTKKYFIYQGAAGSPSDKIGSIMSSPMINGSNKVRAFAYFNQLRPHDQRLFSNKTGEGYTSPKVFSGVTPAY